MKPKNTNFLRFVRYFYQAMMCQKSEWNFFDQGSIDGKSEVKMEKCHLVAELKLKMLNVQKVTFSISTPPPGGTFELLLHFSHLWNIAQKSIIQIFDTFSINKFHWILLHVYQVSLNCIWCMHQSKRLQQYFFKVHSGKKIWNEYRKYTSNDMRRKTHIKCVDFFVSENTVLSGKVI